MIENKTKFNLEYVTHNYRSGWPEDDVKKSFVAQGEYDYVLPPGAVGTQLWRFHQGGALYRVAHLLANLGWVDFDFGCSTLCQVLPGLMGKWQNLLSSWARWWSQPRFASRCVTLYRSLGTIFTLNLVGNHATKSYVTVRIRSVIRLIFVITW